MQPTDARAPFLVLAHHRSGSNFFTDLLQAHPQLECINEPLSMHTGFFRDCDLEPWTQDDFDARWLHRALMPHESLRRFLLALRQLLQQSSTRRVVGFKETGLFGKLQWWNCFVPGMKLIWLRRDPRAVVSSVLRSGLIPLWKYEELVSPAYALLCPHYRSAVDPFDAPVRAAELTAMSICVREVLVQRSLGLFDHCVIRLEELSRRPEPLLQDLAIFLGVDAHDEPVRFLRARQGGSRGGMFSSFRSLEDVESAWRERLSRPQVDAIEHVLQAAPEQAALA